MERQPKILILYAMFGDGHYQVASALKQEFEAKGNSRVKMLDIFAEAHPALDTVFRNIYLKSAVYFPHLYGWSYSWTKEMAPGRPFGRWLHSFGARRLRAIIEAEQPDAVVHTFPFLALYELRRKMQLQTPGYTVITDYELHNRWIHPNTDGYFVATAALRNEMVKRGVRPDKVTVSGIPLRTGFDRPAAASHTHIREKLGLDPHRKQVLVMAGAYGVLSDVKAIMTELLHMEGDLDFILVTGRNKRAYNEMHAMLAERPNVRVLGFVKEIQELMAVSSCIVTKAGGITLTEAFSLGLPVVVYNPLPGQEKGNAEFWSKQGALRIASSLGELRQAVSLQTSMAREARPSRRDFIRPASETVVETVLGRIGDRSLEGLPAPASRGRKFAHEYS